MRTRAEAARWFVQTLAGVSVLAAATTSSITLAQNEGQLEGESLEDYRRRVNQQQFDEALFPPENIHNAAVIYQQAFLELVMVDTELEEYWDQVHDRLDTAPGPDAYRISAVSALLDRSSSALELAHRAANLDYAEFGIDRAQGFEAMLPHLSSMRQLARLMGVQAHAQRANGQTEDAAQTLADMLQLSRHASSDGVLIGSLIGISCGGIAFDSLDDAIARGELDAANAQMVLGALDADVPDPYSFLEGVQAEFDMLVTSMDAFEDPGPELADLLDTFMVSGNEQLDMFRDIDREGMNALLEEAQPGYDLASLAFMEDDPKKARAIIEELETALAHGEYGPLADLMMANLGMALDAKINAEERIAEYERTLRAIASGESPTKFANAAILYAQAFPYLARIGKREQETLDLIRRVVTVTGSCDALPESMLDDVRASLEQAAPVMSLLRTAARFEKCEWKEDVFAEQHGQIIAEGEWVRPMRAALRLLLADAALSICLTQAEGLQGDHALTRSLADALAVAIHLGDGSHLFGSAVAAASIAEVSDLAATAVRTSSLDATAGDIFERRFIRIDGSDPLGWEEARDAMLRPSLHEIVMRYGLSDPVDAARLARNWSGDRLAALAFFQHLSMDENENRDPPFPRYARRGDLYAVTDIVDVSAEDLERLGAPHTRLIELLNAIDTVRPIDTVGWRARGVDGLGSLAETIDTLEAASDALYRGKPARLSPP